MPKKKKIQFGELKPQYHFSLNPYPDSRFTRCPYCETKTGQRKLPLVIHIEPTYMFALNYTNRYCKKCDRLIGHKHEIEYMLTQMFLEIDPTKIGNSYFIFGTLEKHAWREGMKAIIYVDQMRSHMSDFKSYDEIRLTRPGFYFEEEEPPLMEPPASTDWVKQ